MRSTLRVVGLSLAGTLLALLVAYLAYQGYEAAQAALESRPKGEVLLHAD